MSKLHSYDELVTFLSYLQNLGAKISVIGKSGLGRKIHLLTVGKGDKRALIVCRQHGNEPTSTEAMMEYAEELLSKENLIERVRVSIILMANPDGAELYRKVCEKGKASVLSSYIARSVKPYRGDMNRDHKKRKFPEAKAIAKAVEETKPNLILDLHNFFRNYEYTILRRPVHDFCPAFSTNSKIKPETMRISYRICKIAIEAVRGVGGNSAEVNGLWPSFYGRLLMPSEKVLETRYSLNYDVPSATFEAVGGFHLCSRKMQVGKRLHKASTSAVVEQLASDSDCLLLDEH